MILKGSQQGNVAKLDRHPMNAQDNDHVELHACKSPASPWRRTLNSNENLLFDYGVAVPANATAATDITA
jgi:hypothetical protein